MSPRRGLICLWGSIYIDSAVKIFHPVFFFFSSLNQSQMVCSKRPKANGEIFECERWWFRNPHTEPVDMVNIPFFSRFYTPSEKGRWWNLARFLNQPSTVSRVNHGWGQFVGTHVYLTGSNDVTYHAWSGWKDRPQTLKTNLWVVGFLFRGCSRGCSGGNPKDS